MGSSSFASRPQARFRPKVIFTARLPAEFAAPRCLLGTRSPKRSASP
jgi:hypothetical protein